DVCPAAAAYRLTRSRGDEASGANERLGLLCFKRRFSMAQVESKARATSDPDARKGALKRMKDEQVEFVLLWFTDIEGHLKSFAVTPGEVEEALDDGMGFDGSSITGFNAIEESDMVAIPDPDTFRLMPRTEGEPKVARMICDIVTPDGQPYEGDPRYVLRRALERMKSMGFDTFNVGPELEYFLFKDNAGAETLDEGGYFAMTTLDAATELRNETIRALESVGIPIEYHHHEVGPSQHEIDMRYADALNMADHTITYRLIVKEVAAKYGVYVAWSRRNRAALIRIPLYKPGAEQATRAELRCPDPACNPYLTFATLLHAGLEGIERGYELPEPMETNLYHLTPEQRRERGIISLPETLGEAIDELAQSDLVRKALGDHIFERYVELKRKEWDEYRIQLSEWEMARYLPVL